MLIVTNKPNMLSVFLLIVVILTFVAPLSNLSGTYVSEILGETVSDSDSYYATLKNKTRKELILFVSHHPR